ncbi:MAG: riboflavin synthase [Synergistaceae bacterium]|nr:riboflavin synthase [Synergistaceae bacterium]
MFTGLVEAMGRVVKVSTVGAIVKLQIEAPFSRELKKGQSVCVSGACLTVVSYNDTCFSVDVMNETVKRTKFNSLTEKGAGTIVNLERALRAGDRLDGHFVLGHIDGVGAVRSMNDGGSGSYIVKVEAAPEIMRQIVGKGSVALDGVSLTVIDSSEDCFSVGLIPATLSNCTLGILKTGDRLNIETDIIGKYVLAKLYNVLHGNSPNKKSVNSISIEQLTEMGW